MPSREDSPIVHGCKHCVDLASLVVVGGALAGALPAIASGLSAIWLSIRIYESKTVQRWLGRE